MTERITNSEREALITGGRSDTLEPHEAADVPFLAALLADRAAWAEPRASLEHDVIQAVLDDEPSRSNVTDMSGRRRRTNRRPRIMIPAAAAVAAVAILVGSLIAGSGGTSPTFTAQLSATGLVPGARASADIVRNNGGFRFTLDARGLAVLPEGEYYEAWLKDAAGTLVPIGTFSSSDAQVTLWSGVSPATYSTLTVTIEAPDNNQGSSGKVVLRGDVRPG